MRWKVGEAKQGFSRVVREASREPQLILNRDQLVAAVVDPVTFAEFEACRAAKEQRTFARRFEDLRQLCLDEGYVFEVPDRQDRSNPLAETEEDVPV